MWRFLFNISILFLCYSAFAEGTKELRPTESDWGNIEINDQGRPFASSSNTDPHHRLYIHIAKTNEKIYFGFRSDSEETGTFRIKDPSGNVVYKKTNVPTKGEGFIENHAEACAGPKINKSNTNGYNPLSFSPTTTGDYYIEFTAPKKDQTYHLDLFDITVVNKKNKPIKGRLWAYAWDLSCRGNNNSMQTTFYIYTTDKYITSVDMNGIKPYGFVVLSNSTGTDNTGNPSKDRKSVEGNHGYAEHKIFLNIPDPNVYDVADIPKMVENLRILGTPK